METSSIIRQTLPLLILCGIGEVMAGTTLGGMEEFIRDLPGLIVLVPAIMGMKGNITTALGSRLGSAAHLGLISLDDLWNKELKENLTASIMLNVTMCFFAGVLAYFTTLLLGMDVISIFKFVGIALLAGTLAGLIMAFIAVGIMIIAFKRGYDPDNITAPSLATFGDVITLLCIFLSAGVVGVIL